MALPLIVVLHGIQRSRSPRRHVLLSGRGDLRDLARRLVQQGRAAPFLLAGPSQTRDSQDAGSLWTGERFHLGGFVDRLERALVRAGVRAEIDRARVAVLAHSGAGCALRGASGNGVFRVVHRLDDLARRGIEVRWVGLMDTCLFGGHGARWLRRELGGRATRVGVMWTSPEEWRSPGFRHPWTFARVLGARRSLRCDPERYASCRQTVRGGWVIHARRGALRRAVRPGVWGAPAPSPHVALAGWFLEELVTRWLGGERKSPRRSVAPVASVPRPGSREGPALTLPRRIS